MILSDPNAFQSMWQLRYGGHKINLSSSNDPWLSCLQAIWEAAIDGEVLLCKREVGNIHNTFCSGCEGKTGVIVGHCPQKISSLCSIFIRQGGSITCQVSASRQYSEDLPQGGLEVPCI